MKKTLIAGLATLLPLTLTIFLFIFLIDVLTTPFLYLVEEGVMDFARRKIGPVPTDLVIFISRLIVLILLFFLTCLLGLLARKFFFRSLISLTHEIFSRIPFLRSIFKVSTEITKALFSSGGKKEKAFRKPAMVPFPSRKSDCIGFVSGSIPKACSEKVPDLVPVFVPTSPHPISGYMMLVPKNEALNIEMTNEDAVKFTVSCGMIVPSTMKPS